MRFLTVLMGALLTGMVGAFPPAPHHEVYGVVRDETGTPLSGAATVLLNGPLGTVISGTVDSRIGLGVNYSLKVPMDAGTLAQLYQATALLPSAPFTVEVVIGGTSYVPIEVQGAQPTIGEAGGRTRLDLTLGIDSDGDGLPDAFEQQIIAATDATSLDDVTPDGDNDGDGVSNRLEYIAGTYAFSAQAVFRLDVIDVQDGLARLRFLAGKGRSYQIMSSTDGETFGETAFSFHPDGSHAQDSHRSELIRFEEVYIPSDGLPSRFFRLHVY